MKNKLIEYSSIIGIAMIIGFVQALASVLIGESLTTTIILWILANYIYSSLRIDKKE